MVQLSEKVKAYKIHVLVSANSVYKGKSICRWNLVHVFATCTYAYPQGEVAANAVCEVVYKVLNI